MASRAEDRRERAASGPAATGQSRPHGAVRAALTDYYFNSLRLVPANVVWGATVILVVLVALWWPLGGLLSLPILALPTAGVFAVAARAVRGGAGGGLADSLFAYRRAPGSTLLLGAAWVAAGLVLATNLVIGLGRGDPFGWGLATLAGWGLIALWCGSLVAWPLVVDPARADRPLGDRLRLAGQLLLVEPRRFATLGLAAAIIAAVSIVLTAAILTVSVAFIALIACRTVYGVADRLEPDLERDIPSALDGDRP